MYIERNVVSGHYGTKDFDDSDNEKENEGNYTLWVIKKDINVVTPYTYDEAISLAGHGPYTVSLVGVCCLAHLAMCLDMFGFSTVVAGSSCELQIGQWQFNVLLSMPVLGAILSSYFWGYISDTRGRRLSLIVTMWVSFIATTASAFSPNWIVLAVLKFISVSFCSAARAASYTLVGECCPVEVKRTYFFILSSVMHLPSAIYTGLGYISLNMGFSWDLGFITFTPWRLMVLCFAAPLGISAICLHFFYESPKFLANVGNKEQALKNLRAIWKRNRCVGKKYPVEKLIFEEAGSGLKKNKPLLQSLWEQTTPLFKKPLIFRTLQLYFLSVITCSATNSLMIWFPALTNAFISGMSSNSTANGMCKIIEYSQNLTETDYSHTCIQKSDVTVVWASTVQSLALFVFNIIICWVGDRKLLVIVIMSMVSASAAGCAVIEDNIISLLLFFTMFLGVVVNGIVSSFFVDFFPTSYRGMAACLSVIVTRISGLLDMNFSRLFIISHCSYTFYVIAATTLCGVLVACFLPSDREKREKIPKKILKKKLSF